MSFDTPLVEYLIIGTHTFSWVLLLVMAVFQIPLSKLTDIEASTVLLFLPFVYLLGMTTDSIVQYPLDPFRKKIRDSLFKYENYKDEYIALKSPELYSAYDSRVRRVRVVGSAIFNWLLLGVCLLLNTGFANGYQTIFIITSSVILCVISIIVWKSLYYRAYTFRKNACDLIKRNNKA